MTQNIIHPTNELLLTQYFTFTALFAHHGLIRERLFERLAGAFLLHPGAEEELYRLAEDESVRSIETAADYYRRERLKRYAELENYAIDTDPAVEAVISVKGSTLIALSELKLNRSGIDSAASAYEDVARLARGGNVTALRTLGVMQYEGILVRKDPAEGERYLTAAARWNDTAAILLAIHYGCGDRADLFRRLGAVVKGTPYAVLAMRFGECCFGDEAEATETPRTNCAEYELLEQAFAEGVLKRDTYLESYARVLNSPRLSTREKERLVLSGGREAVTEAGKLPYELTEGTIPFDLGTARPAREFARERRDVEFGRLEEAIRVSDLCATDPYRPLCLVSRSDYLLRRIYGELLIGAAEKGVNVVSIDVATISTYDLEPTLENLFVRSAVENTANVYLFHFRGTIDPKIAERVCDFLESEKRRNFRLFRPSVTLDLSPILPICFADRENAVFLRGVTETVYLAEVNAREKYAEFPQILHRCAERYRMPELSFSKEAAERLVSFSIDDAEQVIDRAARIHRGKHGTGPEIEKEIPIETVEQAIRDGERRGHVYGFGKTRAS